MNENRCPYLRMERQISRISEVLYVGLCDIIGTPTQVKIRRDVTDTCEVIQGQLCKVGGRLMLSGSFCEGFRLATSDVDYMIWSTYDIVTCDLSQIPPYYPTQTLILMECHDTPPGFAKLQLLTPPNNDIMRQSCVSVNDQVYISSSLYREKMHDLSSSSFPVKLHGPCTNGFVRQTEYDCAYCFSCPQWPPTANQWIDRCQGQGWPLPQVLQDIISDGCHFVAMGSRRWPSLQQCETEWRMSFSQAEYKLVSSMNHIQFLCYGLLKIFLKEVLNDGTDDPLLCSYFMKTTLFWKIQENTISVWCSQNILYCVWVCFKYLIQCVYRGEFPNFFIPQNNMFINKIHGVTQEKLFLRLLNLYNMGFSCLLLSPSVYQILTKAILKPWLQVSTDEKSIIPEIKLDMELFKELFKVRYSLNSLTLKECFAFIKTMDDIYKAIPPSSQYHIVAHSVIRNTFLIGISFRLDKTKQDNKHTTYNRPLDMLVSAAESGCVSDTLYVAIYFYNKKRYMEALYYIERTRQMLSQPYVFGMFTDNVNSKKYMEVLGNQSLLTKFRKAVSFDIIFEEYCIIDELRLELYVTMGPYLRVPPLVMTHMLSFLCHHHLRDRLRSRQSVEDLQILLHYGEGYCIPSDLSWQILGICQQISANKERALYSYQNSLEQYPFHNIQTATLTRIQNMLSE